MKYKGKIYAEALANAILDKKLDEKKVIHNFLGLLEKNQDVKKAEEIIVLAQKLLLKKTGHKKVVLETARKINAKDSMKSFFKNGDIVEEKINPALVAGIKIIIDNERQLDNSLSGKLNKI